MPRPLLEGKIDGLGTRDHRGAGHETRDMKVIERASYRSMPWKNGAGSTTQIAIFPVDATTDDFEWRISMAVVNADGPFSIFPGTQRTLVVLEGAGIDLAVEGTQPAKIEQGSVPFTFAADAAANAKLIDGPILDLNIMTRRDRFEYCVWRFSEPIARTSEGTIVVFAQNTNLHIQHGSQSTRIASGDTAVFSDVKAFGIIPETSGDYYLVEFNKIKRRL